MPSDESFDDLMARLRRGDNDAAAQLFQRFATRVIGLARARLDQRIRQKVDPEDVLQSVLKSFFVRYADGQYDLRDWDSLWSLLVSITLHKCGHKIRNFHAGRRDVRREGTAPPANDDTVRTWEGLAREPNPEEAAALADEVEALVRDLSERDRAIVSLRLQGYTPTETAAQLGLLERTVCRVLERVRRRLREHLDAEFDGD